MSEGAIRRDKAYENNVFVNFPFDESYVGLRNAMIFAIFDCGFSPLCALEEDNGGQMRFDKIKRMIARSKFGIHDLSKTDIDAHIGRSYLSGLLQVCVRMVGISSDLALTSAIGFFDIVRPMPNPISQSQTLFDDSKRRMAEGDLADAERVLREALALHPDFGEAHANLAWLREQAHAFDEAEGHYRRAIAIGVMQPQLYLNVGVLLMNAKRFDEAEIFTRRALELAPERAAAWSNLGVLLACQQHEDEAENCYRTALELDGNYARAKVNLAYILLRQGRLDEGWRNLEARDQYAQVAHHFDCPRWQGEPLAGKAIVITFEVGHGDMILFCRYTALLKALGAAKVTVVCHPGLKQLFATLRGADQVYSLQDDVPRAGWDFWSPPLSLPHLFRTNLDTIPAPIPYLSATAERTAYWAGRLARGDASAVARVGLVWKGNPGFENDAERSLESLATLAALGAVGGIHFVSLQKGAGENEALTPPPGMTLNAFGSELDDFADTAALIANLDLVISVDTAVAHLAGALGKPCWVLLPDFKPDWRWLRERSDTPWYPTMRLFRQPRGGGWETVASTVALALAAWQRERDAR